MSDPEPETSDPNREGPMVATYEAPEGATLLDVFGVDLSDIEGVNE